MKFQLLLAVYIIPACLLFSCKEQKRSLPGPLKIASGQMPNITKDNSGQLHLVYGTGDSIMYSSSADDGNTFTTPSLINVLPGLVTSLPAVPRLLFQIMV